MLEGRVRTENSAQGRPAQSVPPASEWENGGVQGWRKEREIPGIPEQARTGQRRASIGGHLFCASGLRDQGRSGPPAGGAERWPGRAPAGCSLAAPSGRLKDVSCGLFAEHAARGGRALGPGAGDLPLLRCAGCSACTALRAWLHCAVLRAATGGATWQSPLVRHQGCAPVPLPQAGRAAPSARCTLSTARATSSSSALTGTTLSERLGLQGEGGIAGICRQEGALAAGNADENSGLGWREEQRGLRGEVKQ